MNSFKPMYFLTCFQKAEIENGTPSIGKRVCYGYCEDKELLIDGITHSIDNMYDNNIYEYAVIEKIPQGLMWPSAAEMFFKYDSINKCYEAIERPTALKYINDFSLA